MSSLDPIILALRRDLVNDLVLERYDHLMFSWPVSELWHTHDKTNTIVGVMCLSAPKLLLPLPVLENLMPLRNILPSSRNLRFSKGKIQMIIEKVQVAKLEQTFASIKERNSVRDRFSTGGSTRLLLRGREDLAKSLT